MKIFDQKNLRQSHFEKSKRRQEGLATVVFITLLAIMGLLASAETMALIYLHREVKFLEKQQIKRLNESQTKSVAIARSNINNEDSK